MTVGKQHRIDARDAMGEHLLSEVRTRIDEDRCPSLDVNVDGWAQPAVARVRRPAHGTGAADHGNPGRRAGAEEGNPRKKGHPLLRSGLKGG